MSDAEHVAPVVNLAQKRGEAWAKRQPNANELLRRAILDAAAQLTGVPVPPPARPPAKVIQFRRAF